MTAFPSVRLLIFALALTLVSGCVSAPTAQVPAGPAEPAIVKSPNDDRSYRFTRLENQLEVLLISDPDTDKAAASLTVFRGSFDEPAERPGLAHFLEHMLFLGTEEFPIVDDYRKFIETHGGGSNAYTASDHTNYFFDIKAEELTGALDRFSAFFTSPNFDAAYVDREKNAVNSEYQMQIKDDGWRGYMVAKRAMNPDYPGSRFSIGSLETLDGNVRSDLLAWFEANYSADQMALVVLGREDLDTLARMVKARFVDIPNRNLGPGATPGPMFAPGQLPSLLTYQTIKDTHSLSYTFPLPSIDSYYASKPTSYIANLLGHEAEGTLVANLKDRGWIQSLSAGGGRMDRDNAMISVNIELTERGVGHLDEITAALFGYIATIREHGIEAWRYEEQAKVADLGFRFQEQAKPGYYVRTLAPSMALYPPEDLLAAPYLMQGFDETLIRRFLSYLTPENVFVEIAGPDVETTNVDPWFDVPYRVAPLSPPDTHTTDFVLQLPDVNRFLPEETTVKPLAEDKPAIVARAEGLKVWGATDTSFGTPRASTYVRLAVDGGFTNPRDLAYAHLFARLVRDELNPQAYAAELAGLSYSISADGIGFELSISGYDDNQDVLLDEMLAAVVDLTPDPDKVALFREELSRDWRNFRSERPFLQTYSGVSHLLLSTSWPPAMLADAADKMTAESLATWREERLGSFSAQVLVHGNVDGGDFAQVAATLTERLPLRRFASYQPTVVKLDDSAPLTYPLEIDHNDAAVTLYVQGANDSIEERALFGLAAQMLSSPYFTALRTEQQLGYVVMTAPWAVRNTPGLVFVVQSPVTGADTITASTEAFLRDYRKTLDALTEDELDAQKQGFIARLTEQDKTLFARSRRYWLDLELNFLNFDSREQIAAAAAVINRQSFVAFYDRLMRAATRQRLVLYSDGQFGGTVPGAVIDDVTAFKEG